MPNDTRKTPVCDLCADALRNTVGARCRGRSLERLCWACIDGLAGTERIELDASVPIVVGKHDAQHFLAAMRRWGHLPKEASA